MSGGIIEKIIATARARAEESLRESEARRDAVVAEGLARLDAELQERLAQERKRILDAGSREISSFRLAERNRLRVRKRALLEGVYEAAWEKSLAPDAFKRWAEKKIAAVCRKGDSLIVAAAQARAFSAELSDVLARHGVVLSKETGSFRAGFIVERGSVRLNCTLDKEMEAAIRDKEIEISRVLFGKAR